ncbi:MAG: methylglyoxal synthase [Bacteroidetes bacterium]|nr:MAG: methylglyoxal synthase [Bacteroidota bacterium]
MPNKRKTIALVAHDNRKKELVEWADWNRDALLNHDVICTGTTGKIIEETLTSKLTPTEMRDFRLTRLKSGPLGGDQQLGSLIVDGKIDMMVFFWDPMQQQAHDVDVKALLRITVLYNVPTACNRATADFLISSGLFDKEYLPKPMNVDDYLNRVIDI